MKSQKSPWAFRDALQAVPGRRETLWWVLRNLHELGLIRWQSSAPYGRHWSVDRSWYTHGPSPAERVTYIMDLFVIHVTVKRETKGVANA